MSDLQRSLVVSPDPEGLPGRCCNCAKKPGVPSIPQHEGPLRLVRQGAQLSPAPRFSAWPLLIVMQNGLSARNSVAVVIAAAVVLVVAIVIATLWTGIGDSEISSAGWFAMGLGVVVTLALGIGLMALVFVSSRRGYDELGRRDS
jgi:hypothetical protein